MDKKEFQETFKDLVDGLTETVSTLGISGRVKPYFKPETIQKWYDGLSVPANATREMVINYLHAEQKKRKSDDTIRKFIKDNLRIDVERESDFYDSSSRVTIKLKLGDEIISDDSFSLKDFI